MVFEIPTLEASIAGRVSAAQDYIASMVSADSIASQWEQILEKA